MASTSTSRTIFINSKEAVAGLEQLTKQATALRSELLQLSPASEEFVTKSRELGKVEAQVSKLTKKYGTLEEQQKRLAELTELIKDLTLEATMAEGKALDDLTEQIQKATKEYDQLNRAANGYSKTVSKKETQTTSNGSDFGGAGKLASAAAVLYAAREVAVFAGELGKAAVELDTIDKKARTVFGETFPQVEAAARNSATELGLSTAQYIKAAASIQDLLVPMGFQRQSATDITVQLVSLSGALAEWSGGQRSAEEVSNILTKALLGEREELKSLGISISEEDVKNRLSAEGKDKLTGKALEQAKAMTTLSLVMEKSTDAQAAYANGSDSMIRQQQRATAQISEIKDNLARIFDGVARKGLAALSPILEGVNNLLAQFAGKAQTAADKTRVMQSEFNSEIEVLKNGNFTQEERKKLIDGINQKYGAYLPNLISEKDNIAKIEAAQKAANKQFEKKILLLAYEEDYTKIVKEQAKAAQQAFELEKARTRVNITKDKKAQITSASGRTITYDDGGTQDQKLEDSFAQARDRMRKEVEKLEKLKAELKERAEATAKELGATLFSIGEEFNDNNTGTSTGNPQNDDKAQKEIDRDKEKYARLRELYEQYLRDIEQRTMSAIEKEGVNIKEKYDKQIAETSELLNSKEPKVRADAAKLIKDLETAKANELLALNQKYLNDLQTAMDKHNADVQQVFLTDEQKDIERIKEKYAKNIALAIELEAQTANGTAATREKAHQDRLALETLQANEIAALKERNRLVQAAKDAVENQKFFEQQKKDSEAVEKKIADAITKSQEQALKDREEALKASNADPKSKEQEQLAILQAQNANEIAVLNQHFQELRQLAEYWGYDSTALEEQRQKELAAIQGKYQSQTVKTEKEAMTMRLQAYASGFQTLGQGVQALGTLFAGEGEKNKKLQRGFALAQIAFDTASAISSLVAAANANPLNAVTFGGAGFTQYATGIIAIITNIAKAKKILTEEQKAAGGYTYYVGASDGKLYNTRNIGSPETGMLNYSTPVNINSATGKTIIANERGVEYFVAAHDLQNPEIAYHTRIIDNISRKRQFVDGGYTDYETVSSTLLNPQNSSTSAPMASQFAAMQEQMNTNTAVLMQILQNGVVARFENIYETANGVTNAQNRNNEIQGR